MKRILSLTLALVMVLGTFTGVFAAEQSVEEFAAEFLEKKGVLLGDDKGDLMLKDNLERRDAVVLLSRLLGVEEVAREFPTSEESPSWTDVRTDAYYVPFFAWAEANEYFEGNDNGTFAPRAEITAPEYALVLLRALGYEVNGHESWKASLETAEKIGLLKDVEVKFEDKVARGEMAVMTFNALGTKIKDSEKTLAEELGIELPVFEATELTAEVNDTENLAEVVLELSNAKLADAAKLERVSNYRISGDRVVKFAKVEGNNVVLTLEESTPLVKGRTYTLTVKNIDRAINDEYKFKAQDNTVPAVEKVEVLGEYGIKVTTTEPISNPQSRNFMIDGKRVSMNIEQYGRDIVLTPYHETKFAKDASELTILELKDYAGYTSTLIKEEIEIINDDVAPEVVSATRAGNTITVIFDKDIYNPSVNGKVNSRDLGNISYRDGRATFYANEKSTVAKDGKVDNNVAKYTFTNELPRNVEVTIEGVKNHSNVKMERTVIQPELALDEESAEIINNDKRKSLEIYEGEVALNIKFDKDVNINSINSVYSNYFTLYEKEVTNRDKVTNVAINSVSYKQDNRGNDVRDELVVKFDAANLKQNNYNKDYDYILEVENIRDMSNNRIARSYIDFEVVVKTPFTIDRVSFSGNNRETEIVIDFSHPVDRIKALDIENYFLDNTDLSELNAEAIVDNNGRRVTLVIPEAVRDLQADYTELEILPRVTRLNGERISNETVWTWSNISASYGVMRPVR